MHTCPFTWTDGWGSHSCGRVAEHDGAHRCECDASHTVDRPTAQPDDSLRLYGGVDQNTRHFPKPFPPFVAPESTSAQRAADLMAEAQASLVRQLLANRPKCPAHPDVFVEPDPSQPMPDLAGMTAESGYTITMHWRCPHPDHDPDHCAGVGPFACSLPRDHDGDCMLWAE
jgi:hypothetical protein